MLKDVMTVTGNPALLSVLGSQLLFDIKETRRGHNIDRVEGDHARSSNAAYLEFATVSPRSPTTKVL